MNKTIISIAAALMLCSFDLSGAAVRGVKISNGCICSFLTIPSSSDSREEDAVISEGDIEYGCKLYEFIKKLFG